MRILIVNYEYPPTGGGAATASEAIAKELVKQGHAVFVLTGSGKGLPAFYEENGIAIHRVASLRRAADRSGILEMASFLVAGLLAAPGIMRKREIDAAIIFFSLPCGPIGLLGRLLCGIPYIVSLRGGDVPGTEPSLEWAYRLVAPVRRAVFRHSVAVVANSTGLQRMAEEADRFPVQVIPNGVDTEFFRPNSTRSTSPRSESRLRILFVGRFQKQKNLQLLLEQVAQLPPDTFELHLVGDGPENRHLRQCAEKLGIAKSIKWHGWLSRSALPSVYQSVDCLVNASLYEGMPNVVLEAMACGLPVIVSKIAGHEAIVANGGTGFLFDLGEPETLTFALKQMADVDLRRHMGAAARARVLAAFTWRKVAEAYLDLFPH
jgi:glycosyltransferase involved in cell wall biosynthesis